MKKLFLIPYTFTLMNWAAVVSLYYFVRSGDEVWKDVWTAHSPANSSSKPDLLEKEVA